jgi:hypothetical protein
MNTKSFVSLIVAVLVLGGSLGGAFVGGIALGKSQAEAATPSIAPLSATDQQDQTTQEQLDDLRQRIQSGEFNPDQFRQQFQGQFGRGGGGGGFGGGGLTGPIEEILGDTVTVNTSQGPLLASIGPDTTIQLFTEGTLADLLVGMNVTVIGQPGEDGTVQATSIVLVPEDGTGFFGRERFPGDGSGGQQSP